MQAGEPRRFGLEVRFDAEPIEGRLYERENGDAQGRPFCGWLGLMSVIEAAGREPAREREAR